MALVGIDLGRAIRTYAERLALVEAVANASNSEQETEWIEWKSGLDLTTVETQFELAKHILGYANRHPDVAGATLGGCAYLLVGVEPGNTQGIQPIDSAQLGKAIDAYTGGSAGPQWSPDYVNRQGRIVLVITVEPPGWGDAIHTLRRGFGTFKAGVIFVRRKGETEQANPAEVLMLQERAARRTARISVDLRWDGATPEIPAAAASEHEIEEWANQERAELLGYLRSSEGRASGPLAAAVAGSEFFRESRSPQEYQAEVDDYLAAAGPAMVGRLRRTAVWRSQPVSVVLINLTETNFKDVRCELRVDGHIWSVIDRDDGKELGPYFPKRPAPYGAPQLPFQGLQLDTSRLLLRPPPQARVVNSGSFRIIFDPVDLRPFHQIALQSFRLVADGDLVGETVIARWTATAKNVDGVAAGSLPISVEAKTFRISSLAKAKP